MGVIPRALSILKPLIWGEFVLNTCYRKAGCCEVPGFFFYKRERTASFWAILKQTNTQKQNGYEDNF